MDSWVLTVLLRDMKTIIKNKDQPTIIKKNRKLKNNRKIKVMRSIAPTMDQFSRDGYMEENDP